ncbi:U2 small nuclear ribonucleoprotein A' [Spathaspora sp. JA1]|nr:U2 small nuclear ribonucleoprotein A' [Spathaspora sp. JA1]
MRLTSQVINEAPIILNPEKKLTLQLRNLQIPTIENLGITQDKFQVIDLTNNELIELGNIPSGFKNLETLLLGNNNIAYIDENFPQDNYITSISLINNNIYKFQIEFSKKFKRLENLILIGNPITELSNYRLFIVWLIPSLKVLDFKKVKPRERIEAIEKFGKIDSSSDEFNTNVLTMLAKSSEKQATTNGVAAGSNSAVNKTMNTVVKKLTEAERRELLHKLNSATSIHEIEEIESALKRGSI